MPTPEPSMRSLALLATAIAGRPVPVVLTDAAAASTDGIAIHLPRALDPPAARTAVVVQAALLAGGSLERSLASKLTGRGATRRYLTLEAARTATLLEAVLPPAVRRLVAATWDGPVPATRDESLARARSREAIPPAPDAFGTIRWRSLPRAPLDSTSEPDERAPLVLERPAPAATPEDDLVDDDEDDELSSLLRRLGRGLGRDTAVGRRLQRLLGQRRRVPASGEGAGDDSVSPSRARPFERARAGSGFAVAPADGHDDPPPAVGTHVYPEWDLRAGAYRPRWCRVVELDPTEGGRPPVRPQTSRALRRNLARIGLSPVRHVRQPEGDRLDLEAVVDLALARAAGEAPDERVYEASLRTGRDLGVLVLLDASGSTADRGARASIWEGHRRIAADLAGALEEIGDRVGVYAFSTHGRQGRFLRIKGFDGRFDAAAQRRLGALEPAGFTRLGLAVRHATHLLVQGAGTPRLLLIVVSDGLAYDDGYEGTHAEADVRRALAEAARLGVAPVCISVASATDEATLDRLWGHVPHGHLTEPAELADQVEPLLRAALEGALRVAV